MEKFNGKPVVVFIIRVNINQKARTIEEVLSQRKQTAVTFTANVTKELTFDVKLISNADSASARVGLKLKELLATYKKKRAQSGTIQMSISRRLYGKCWRLNRLLYQNL